MEVDVSIGGMARRWDLVFGMGSLFVAGSRRDGTV